MSFRVKALYAYSSEHDDDLNFDEGQIITITDEEDADWYTGEYTDEATGQHREGLFPRNFVERYEPVTPPRPARRPPAPAPAMPTAPAPAPAPVHEPEPEPESEPEPEPEPEPAAPVAAAPPPAARAPPPTQEHEEEDESEEEEEPPQREPAPPPPMATKPVPPPVQSPPPQATKPAPAPAPAPAAPPEAARSPPPAAAEPPSKPAVAEKPTGSSFKDRIAAFNRGGAAPVAPPKPGGLGGGSQGTPYVRKAYVAPPPSRNAYVPPSTQAPVAKIYRREEDPEFKASQEEAAAPPPAPDASADKNEDEEDQPKPMSLKERMAMLQKQQLEQQARHADAAAKKARPKPPPKKTSSGPSQPPPVPEAAHDGAAAAATAAEAPPPPARVLSDESLKAEPPAVPSHDAGESQDEAEHAPRETPRIPQIPKREAAPAETAGDEIEEAEPAPEGGAAEEDEGREEEEEEVEEEMDPEIRRRMEIRERMAKMSGGMGMGGMGMGAMFGAPALPGMGKRKPSKPKSAAEPPADLDSSTGTSPPAQAIPVMPVMAMPGMALPGMGMPRPKKQEEVVEEPEVEQEDEPEHVAEPISARSPTDVPDVEDVKRQSTDRSREVEPEKVLSPTLPPQVHPVAEESRRRSVAPTSPTAGRSAPPVPQRAPEAPEERAARPPPPAQVASPTSPTSPPATSNADKRASRVPPPIPGSTPTSATGPAPTSNRYSRGPPPPPPSQPPPRQSAEVSRFDDSDEGEENEEEEESEAEEEPKGRNSEELHHAGLPSLGPGAGLRSPPPPPVPGSVTSPRGAPPPPPPSQPPRQSREMPRAPPPVPPPAQSPPADMDYDPYNYESNPLGVTGTSTVTSPRIEVQTQDMYDASPPTSPSSRAPPPLPPMKSPPTQPVPPVPSQAQAPPSQAAPPLPPPQVPIEPAPPAPPPHASTTAPAPAPPTHASPAIPQNSRKSLDVLTSVPSRRSVDVSRISAEHNDYIASDVNIGRESGWWTQRRTPPPVFANRNDVSVEYDESTTVQSDGRPLIAKHVYVLHMDYSQTIITAFFSQEDPAGSADFQQRHEPPPAKMRQDQLEAAHVKFGAKLAAATKAKENHTVGDGSPLAFVSELIRGMSEALAPVGSRAFGAIVYSNLANATVQQHDEIRSGDVLSFRNARLQGHKGAMKQKYSLDLAAHVGFVLDWDGTKQKVRVYEQNGKKVKVESYKLGDLRTGEAKIWRVMGRDWVGWGVANWV